jgi:hypothetical protein
MYRKVMFACVVALVFCSLCLVSTASAGIVMFGDSPATANTGGGCAAATNCTFFQAEDSGAPSWEAPTDGVLTSYSIRAGSTLAVGDTAQLKVFRPGAGSSWTVVGASPAGSFFTYGSPALRDTFPARIKLKAGDRIGLTVHISGNTAWKSPGSSGEVLATVNGAAPGVGATLTPMNLFASNERLNLDTTIEPDADDDGFGDDSQDLCPGNPARGETGCSGTVVGSDFQLPYNATTACASCIYFNTSVSSGAATSPIDGVIVRWRTYSYNAGESLTLSVLHPEGGDVRVVAKSPALNTGSAPSGIVVSSPVRIPIRAGDMLGVEGSPANFYAYAHGGVGAWTLINPSVDVGALGTPIPLNNDFELLFGADVEPDADHDGFGDETQDACPSDAVELAACPEPVVSGFKFSPSKFAVKKRGAVVSAKKPAQGSKLKLTLSKASRVSFVVNLKATGRKVGKKCVKRTAKNRAKKRCTYYPRFWKFERDLPAGASALAFSGRMKKGRKTQALPTGSYVVTAYPLSSLSRVDGKVAKTTMKIVK